MNRADGLDGRKMSFHTGSALRRIPINSIGTRWFGGFGFCHAPRAGGQIPSAAVAERLVENFLSPLDVALCFPDSPPTAQQNAVRKLNEIIFYPDARTRIAREFRECAGQARPHESDVMLAAASDAVILAFNVRPVGDARAVADREGVEIRHYSVIYRAIDELRSAMQGMLAPEEGEETLGSAEVRQIFRASRVGTIAGSHVTEGKITRGSKVRLVRDGNVV